MSYLFGDGSFYFYFTIPKNDPNNTLSLPFAKLGDRDFFLSLIKSVLD
jgi:hypothetical protein